MRRLVGLHEEDEEEEVTLKVTLGSCFFATVEVTFFSSLGTSFLVTAEVPLARSEPMLQASTSSKSRAARADSDDSWMDRPLLSPFTENGGQTHDVESQDVASFVGQDGEQDGVSGDVHND